MTHCMKEKNFTYTLKDIPQNFKKIAGGSYSDQEFEISLEIMSKTTQEIKFSVLITKCPKVIPFWAVLYIRVKDQETKCFINYDKKGKKSFETPFTSDIFTEDTTITYKIKQIQSYICPLSNDGCLCYLNCALQLFFHLSKFHSLLNIVSSDADSVPYWINNLNQLFQKMSYSKTCLSTDELTKSFGWPSLARRIPHDASEFIQIILDRIRNYFCTNDFFKRQRHLDEIFLSQIFTKAEDSKSEDQVESKYIFDIQIKKEQTLDDTLKDVKFQKFPEVLFISPIGMNIKNLPKKLDLSKNGCKQNMKHTKYTLSGIIFRKRTLTGICHFTLFVRASSEEVWLYFDDSAVIVYPWKYKRSLKKYLFPLDNEILNKFEKNQIRLLMYIADDVINDYFSSYPLVFPPKFSVTEKVDFSKIDRKIMITSEDDIKNYVESGHTDFEEVESSLTFDISPNSTYSNVYERVAKEFNVPVNSFILRTETKTGSPSLHNFPNEKKELKNIERYSIHLYYEEVKKERQPLTLYIPFYFLLFKFNPNSYIRNITNNLNHSSEINILKSMPLPHKKKKIIKRTTSSSRNNEEEPDKKTEKNKKKNQEKNCFHFLTSLVLPSNSNFNSILDKLIEEINLKDTSKKHSKVTLYTAEHADDEEKISYKKIDTNKEIKEYLNETYIYVQCDDDFLEEDDEDSNIIAKFLFFKYMNQIYKNQIYPKEMPYVFMMEKYGVPVTFCKLTDPKNKLKTMLFPIKIQIKNVEELKKIICAAMGEKYPDNGLMQLFFGFRSENLPPFHDPIIGERNIKSVTTILNHSLQNSTNATKKIMLSAKSSKNDLLAKIDENKIIETDTDYSSNIFIHYHIFDQFTQHQEISVRVYFSKNSISIDYVSQVKVPIDSKVSNIIYRLREIFENKLDEQDVQNLIKIEKNEMDFAEVFRVIQTSNGKISRKLELNFSLNSSMEIRVERIINDYNKDDIECYIPVYYGAHYYPSDDVKYETLYVGSVGTPFYLPVLKSDFLDPNINTEKNFGNSVLYNRLKSMTSEKLFDLFVVNYFGMIQNNVRVNELNTIIEKKLNYCICINDMNASNFIDEVKFFTDDIRIIC